MSFWNTLWGLFTSVWALILPLLLGLLGGCQDVQQNQNVLKFLQEAKASGHLVVTGDAAGKVGMRQEFFLGADGTTISFNGNINFGDNVRNVSKPEPDGDGT